MHYSNETTSTHIMSSGTFRNSTEESQGKAFSQSLARNANILRVYVVIEGLETSLLSTLIALTVPDFVETIPILSGF